MTKTNITAICCVLAAAGVAAGSFAIARTRNEVPSPAAASAEARAEVKQVIDEFFEAARSQDWDRAGNTFAADFEIYTDGAVGYDKGSYIKALKDENIETRKMQLNDLEIHVSPDRQVAWAKYRGDFESAIHGKLSRDKTAETLIFEKRERAWKIVRAHASILDSGAAQTGSGGN
jgi:ketosteroid isomerase-like protein